MKTNIYLNAIVLLISALALAKQKQETTNGLENFSNQKFCKCPKADPRDKI